MNFQRTGSTQVIEGEHFEFDSKRRCWVTCDTKQPADSTDQDLCNKAFTNKDHDNWTSFWLALPKLREVKGPDGKTYLYCRFCRTTFPAGGEQKVGDLCMVNVDISTDE